MFQALELPFYQFKNTNDQQNNKIFFSAYIGTVL